MCVGYKLRHTLNGLYSVYKLSPLSPSHPGVMTSGEAHGKSENCLSILMRTPSQTESGKHEGQLSSVVLDGCRCVYL